MVAFTKFEPFVESLHDGVMDLMGVTTADTLKLMLSNTLPTYTTDQTYSDITEIANGNGYTTGGATVTADGVRSSGTFTLRGDEVVWTATGSMATFQYVILYDDTPTGPPAKPLIGAWDHGSGVSLNTNDTFTVKFNNVSTDGTIYTLV
jgi:hypothetical protein